MKSKLSLLILFSILFSYLYSQDSNPLFSRLKAISNSGIDFFNVDGIEITSQTISGEFSKKNVFKKFRKYNIKEADLNQSDSLLNYQNFYVTKKEEIAPGVVQTTSYYFIELPNTGIRAVSFAANNKNIREFEREFVQLLNSNSIPQTVYEPLKIDTINFAGRKLGLDPKCRWMGINNVQCPYFGQMNWSVHQTLEDASASVDNQYKIIQAKKQGKIISEELVTVNFEGSEVKAKRVVYDFKGVPSLLAGMSGGKTLTIYFVAAPVRQNFVSCVLSFWNNDVINASGLSPFLDEVMKVNK